MTLMTFVLLAAGLLVLTAGAEALVRGASRIARSLGISPLVVGLTVVSMGTSAPEMAVSTVAAWKGEGDLAYGNVVGSNVFNILFILGISAVITPLVVARKLVRFDVPVMIISALICVLVSLDGHVSRIDGGVMVLLLIAYTWYLVDHARKERSSAKASENDEFQSQFGEVERGAAKIAKNVLFVAAGLALLVLGSRWLVQSATEIARALGLSELVIGLTIIAAGTSLPEVATSILAAIRGERDIAIGNVVGSNIFNILGCLGVAAAVSRTGVAVSPAAEAFDLPVMVAVSIAVLPVFLRGYNIERWEGAIFLGYYVAYVAYLVLHAKDHEMLPLFVDAMRWFVLPLTILTFLVIVLRQRSQRNAVGR